MPHTYFVLAIAREEFFLCLLEVQSADFAKNGSCQVLVSPLLVAMAVTGRLMRHVMLLFAVASRASLLFASELLRRHRCR